LTLHFGVPFSLAFLAAGVVAAISSLLLVPIVKLASSSLAVATLGFNIIIYLFMLNEEWATGGSYGMLNVPPPSIFGFKFNTERDLYFLIFAVTGVLSCGV